MKCWKNPETKDLRTTKSSEMPNHEVITEIVIPYT